MTCGPPQKSLDLIKGTSVWYEKRAAIPVSKESIILRGIPKASFSCAVFVKASSLGARNVLFGHLNTDWTMSG
jgi:hypothetical protein